MFEQILSHPIPAVVLLIALLIFVHELGHYLVGRFFGVGVEIFSIGFGPQIFAWRRAGTLYQICAIPLGGYVLFAGSRQSAPVPEIFKNKEFYKAPNLHRAAIVAAGPAANFILALVAFLFVGMKGIPQQPPIVGQVRVGSPADKAGLLYGDEIKKVDNTEITFWRDINEIISRSEAGKALNLQIKRGEELISLAPIPESRSQPSRSGKEVRQSLIGIGLEYIVPIVTINNIDSLAAKSGLKTGDLLLQISATGLEVLEGGAQSTSAGIWKNLASMDEFFIFLQKQIALGATSIRVKYVRDYDRKTLGFDSTKSDSVKEIELDFSNLLGDLLGNLPLDRADKEFGVHVAHLIGIYDSQLTVMAPKAELKTGLEYGDRILAINGQAVSDIYHLSNAFNLIDKATADIEVQRGSTSLRLQVPLSSFEIQAPEGKVTKFNLDVEFLGLRKAPDSVLERYPQIWQAFWFGAKEASKQAAMIVVALFQLMTGELSLKALGGPVMIAQVASESAKLGWQAYLSTMALISINLAVINMFPIPVLDGGQLVMIGFEAVRRRRLSEVAVENFQKLGFVLVLCLVVLSFYNDISRYWLSFFKSLKSFF
ncbi:MAG: RIP metalloprotease RseP [Oligoflexales bacterium]|nr:RIP metalloprotease RseP [Oligoflexales bacterium]